MKLTFKKCLIITIIVLLMSIVILQINTYLDTYYKEIGSTINIGAYYLLIISFYALLVLLGYRIFLFIRNLLKR